MSLFSTNPALPFEIISITLKLLSFEIGFDSFITTLSPILHLLPESCALNFLLFLKYFCILDVSRIFQPKQQPYLSFCLKQLCLLKFYYCR